VNKGEPSKQCFKLEQTFFGFKITDRPILHNNLFDLLWAGEGRWSWDDIYYMPVHLRKFWIKKINKMRTPEDLGEPTQEQAASTATKKIPPQDKIAKPPF
jgi:hypothetical protein